MRVRALFGLFEGNPEEVIFAGALDAIHYELSDDDEWNRLLDDLKATAPHGTTDWREAWLEFDAPDLSSPIIAATTKPAVEQLADNTPQGKGEAR